MNINGISGCCVASNIYNLGGAHGHMTAKNQTDFDNQIRKLGYTSINIAITNSDQNKTREYLQTQGWDTRKVGSLYVSTIKGSDLNAYLRAAKIKKSLEEKIAFNPRFATLNLDIFTGNIKTGVTLEEVRTIIRNNGGRPQDWPFWTSNDNLNTILTAINLRFNIELTSAFVIQKFRDNERRGYWAVPGGWNSVYQLHQSIVRRVANARRSSIN